MAHRPQETQKESTRGTKGSTVLNDGANKVKQDGDKTNGQVNEYVVIGDKGVDTCWISHGPNL